MILKNQFKKNFISNPFILNQHLEHRYVKPKYNIVIYKEKS